MIIVITVNTPELLPLWCLFELLTTRTIVYGIDFHLYYSPKISIAQRTKSTTSIWATLVPVLARLLQQHSSNKIMWRPKTEDRRPIMKRWKMKKERQQQWNKPKNRMNIWMNEWMKYNYNEFRFIYNTGIEFYWDESINPIQSNRVKWIG